MILYTIVDEGYNVEILNKKNLISRLNSLFVSDIYYLNQDNQDICTRSTTKYIISKLDENALIWLFEPDSMDWKFKIQKH